MRGFFASSLSSRVVVLADELRDTPYCVAAHQEPRESGRLAGGVRVGRKLAGAAVHG
jgi:hypothetical protein